MRILPSVSDLPRPYALSLRPAVRITLRWPSRVTAWYAAMAIFPAIDGEWIASANYYAGKPEPNAEGKTHWGGTDVPRCTVMLHGWYHEERPSWENICWKKEAIRLGGKNIK